MTNSLYADKQLTFEPQTKADTTTWKVTIPGLNMGGKMTLHDVNGLTVVIKVAGHTYSVGWGATEYIPAYFILFNTTERAQLDKLHPTRATIESFVLEFPVKRQQELSYGA